MEIKDLEITEVETQTYLATEIITIRWRANIGFGEYELWYDANDDKWRGHSECMDCGDNKDFLKMLLEKFAEKVEVVG